MRKYPDGRVLRESETWNCEICQEYGLFEERNCGGIEKRTKPVLIIGKEKYYQCPLSLITDNNTFFIINLIDWSDNTGIPITGSRLLDQSNELYNIRNFILSERSKARKEIEDLKPKNKKTRNRDTTKSGPKTRIKSGTPVIKRGSAPINKGAIRGVLKNISKGK